MVSVEILSIGNEILLGDVLDTNTQWLCRRIAGLGGQVLRVSILPDVEAGLASQVRRALAGGVDLLITTGGLGPTDDDLTLLAVAEALGRPLELDRGAFDWVQTKYQDLAAQGYVADGDMTPPRIKMARLPQGATPLPNPVGAAPGVLLAEGASTILCFPGVPEEMKAIFERSLEATWRRLFRNAAFGELILVVGCRDESVLAPILRVVAKAHPQVYIKSRAKAFGPDMAFRITLSSTDQSPEQVRANLAAAARQLGERLGESGIPILTSEAL